MCPFWGWGVGTRDGELVWGPNWEQCGIGRQYPTLFTLWFKGSSSLIGFYHLCYMYPCPLIFLDHWDNLFKHFDVNRGPLSSPYSMDLICLFFDTLFV